MIHLTSFFWYQNLIIDLSITHIFESMQLKTICDFKCIDSLFHCARCTDKSTKSMFRWSSIHVLYHWKTILITRVLEMNESTFLITYHSWKQKSWNLIKSCLTKSSFLNVWNWKMQMLIDHCASISTIDIVKLNQSQ